jgi:hypothetical protein
MALVMAVSAVVGPVDADRCGRALCAAAVAGAIKAAHRAVQ